MTTPAKSATIDHVRGKILGTTLTSLDVGSPAVDDIHLDMSREPFVVIAEPSSLDAVHTGDFVSIILTGSGGSQRSQSVVIVPDTAHVFESGRHPWDLPGRKSQIVSGRVTSIEKTGGKTAFVVSYASERRHIAITAGTPVLSLRPGSRAALAEAHAVFVFATTPTSLLTDSVRSVIVGDGALTLPF